MDVVKEIATNLVAIAQIVAMVFLVGVIIFLTVRLAWTAFEDEAIVIETDSKNVDVKPEPGPSIPSPRSLRSSLWPDTEFKPKDR